MCPLWSDSLSRGSLCTAGKLRPPLALAEGISSEYRALNPTPWSLPQKRGSDWPGWFSEENPSSPPWRGPTAPRLALLVLPPSFPSDSLLAPLGMVSRETLLLLVAGTSALLALLLPPSASSVHRVTLLSLLFLGLGLVLFLQGAPYLGLTYLVVYVGAISLLFVFTVMMVHGDLGELRSALPLSDLYPLSHWRRCY